MKIALCGSWLAAICLLLGACQSPNAIALKVGAPPAASLNLRSFETRSFDTPNQEALLQASLATFQDLGFTVTEAAPTIGVLAGSKQRDAHEVGQIAGAVAMAILFGANMPIDTSQDIHVTLVCAPGATEAQSDVRVSFDRYIATTQGLRTELVTDQKIYQQFFDRLSDAIALEKSPT